MSVSVSIVDRYSAQSQSLSVQCTAAEREPKSFQGSLVGFSNREQKCAENYCKWHNKIYLFKLQSSILVISNRNSFRVPFDKIASVYFIWKLYLNWKWPSHGTSTVPVVLAHFRSLCRGCWGCFTSSSEKRIQKDIQWEDTKTEDHGTKGPCILELQTMFSRDCFYLERFF